MRAKGKRLRVAGPRAAVRHGFDARRPRRTDGRIPASFGRIARLLLAQVAVAVEAGRILPPEELAFRRVASRHREMDGRGDGKVVGSETKRRIADPGGCAFFFVQDASSSSVERSMQIVRRLESECGAIFLGALKRKAGGAFHGKSHPVEASACAVLSGMALFVVVIIPGGPWDAFRAAASGGGMLAFSRAREWHVRHTGVVGRRCPPREVRVDAARVLRPG
jgi:hypothetical protein